MPRYTPLAVPLRRALLMATGLCLSCSMLAPAPAHAQADPASAMLDRPLSRVGFVDIPYLIDKAPQALEAEQRLESEFAPRQARLEMQRAELAQLSAELVSQDAELSDEDQVQLDLEVRSLERRIKRNEQDFREELNIRKNTEFKKVRITVLEAIARFGKQLDYDLIVSDGVLFANERIDVTERILEGLREQNRKSQSAN